MREKGGPGSGCCGRNALNSELSESIYQATVGHVYKEIEVRQKVST